MNRRYFAPGCWVEDGDPAEVHIDLSEFLIGHGYADTPENRAMVEVGLRQQMPEATFTEHTDG